MTSRRPIPPDGGIVARCEQRDDRLHRILDLGTGARSSFVTNPEPSSDPRGDWWRAFLRGERPSSEPSPSTTVRALDLFCGVGGLSLGFRQACAELGIDVVFEGACDQDAGALAVFRANHRPRHVAVGSVSNVIDFQVKGARDEATFHYDPEIIDEHWEGLVGEVDVVLAGPPCQGHSNLNNRSRRTDKRNELYLTVPAIAVAIRAPMVIIENVPSVQHDRAGVVASTVTLLKDAGYVVETGILHAARMGWPQVRDRFFLVATRRVPPLPLALVEDALRDDVRSITWAFEDLPTTGVESFMTEEPAYSDANRRRIDWLFDNDAYDLPNHERPECHRGGTTYTSVYGRLYPDRPAPTITTGFMTPGRGRFVHPTERRVLNALEAARLQGFPVTYDFRPDRGAVPSKAQLGKWIGDAVPMPLGYAATLAALGPHYGD